MLAGQAMLCCLGGLAAHVARVIGAHPTISHIKELLHPITLATHAVKIGILFL